jgi:hypothetical protein
MRPQGYFRATCHPWASLVFVLPLVAMYEGSLLAFAQGESDSLRSGSDTWLRWALAHIGVAGLLWVPVLLLGLLLAWALWRRGDRPDTGLLTLWAGMAAESGLFAAVLWGLSHTAVPLLDRFGLAVAPAPGGASAGAENPLEQMIGCLGAGVYEETLFRLLFFSGLIWLLRLLEFPRLTALMLATVASALAFAAAHHMGPYGQPLNTGVFLFRTFAGAYLALLYYWRGFGIAVGAHTAYDVLAGMRV